MEATRNADHCRPPGGATVYEDFKRHTKYLQQPNLLQY